MGNPKLAAPFGRSISRVPLYAPKLSHIPDRSSVSSGDLTPHLAHLLYWFKLRHPHVPHSFATSCSTIFLWHFLLNPSGNLYVTKAVILSEEMYWRKWYGPMYSWAEGGGDFQVAREIPSAGASIVPVSQFLRSIQRSSYFIYRLDIHFRYINVRVIWIVLWDLQLDIIDPAYCYL